MRLATVAAWMVLAGPMGAVEAGPEATRMQLRAAY
jgi:hypothetical protein